MFALEVNLRVRESQIKLGMSAYRFSLKKCLPRDFKSTLDLMGSVDEFVAS